jgi:hypothetical protein
MYVHHIYIYTHTHKPGKCKSSNPVSGVLKDGCRECTEAETEGVLGVWTPFLYRSFLLKVDGFRV